MLFSYNWLQSFFKEKLPKPEKLAELLNFHSFEAEKAEKIKNDFVLDLDVLPNRAHDCFSHIGVAREIAAVTGLKFSVPKTKENRRRNSAANVEIKIKSKGACPRYSAKIINGVEIGPSPKWIREKLEICGLRPINNIVDIVNYVMLETGQPLHAFDFGKISSNGQKGKTKSIIVRKAKEKERITCLDGKKYALNGGILVVADQKNVLAIAGIKGGKAAEIGKNTKTIVLESANFNPSSIRSASRKLNLRTDASARFEQGIDPNLTEYAANRAADLIQEVAAGKAVSGLIDFYPKKVLPKKIKLDLNYAESLLGVKIPKKEIIKILNNLEFKILQPLDSAIKVEIPTFRLDISIQEDLIEEIGRIYGYQNIPAVFPVAALTPPKRNLDIFWENAAKNALKEFGFTEVYNYSFVGDSEKKIFNYSEKKLIELENPISAEYKYLRPDLIANLLENIRQNQKNSNKINIFELGKIFKKTAESGGREAAEKKMLAAAAAAEEKEGKADLFYEMKGAADALLEKMGISDAWYDNVSPSPKETEPSFWNAQRSAEIRAGGGKKIGFVGEIRPKIMEQMKISGKAAAFNIDFGALAEIASEETEYRPVSAYPAAIMDLAVLVPKKTKAADVLSAIAAAGGKLARNIDLFDIYEEKNGGKKSFAFRIIYQSERRTLTGEEVKRRHEKIIKKLEANPRWEVRK